MAAAPLQDFYRAETFTAWCLAFACKRDRVPSFRRPHFLRDAGVIVVVDVCLSLL